MTRRKANHLVCNPYKFNRWCTYVIKDATAHGRILVGPTDESGIGDEVFPAWARRQVDINLAAATTEEKQCK